MLSGKTYSVRVFGCQMNKHDAERICGLLDSTGMNAAPDEDAADVIVFLTCCVRENAVERLRGTVASLKALKDERPELMIAVGGCIGQRDGEEMTAYLPHVDVIFGTHNIASLPRLLVESHETGMTAAEILDSTTELATALPSHRERNWHAWLPITVGCDNFCTYCIVPYVRGRELSRPHEEIVAEAQHLVEDGVAEITLLGQNVNSYGRDLYGAPEFAKVLRAVAATGIERIRFATSHPKDLSDDTIAAMAEEPAICKALHLPVQSGSDRVLALMNRKYDSEHYLGVVDKLYSAMPDIALSTDIIVGFPGETEEDFEDTLRLVRKARFDQAFTFIYSPREGTKAATMGPAVPREVSQARFDRLVEEVHRQARAKNEILEGSVQRVLVEGPSKRDPEVIAGRSEGNKVVHAPSPAGSSPSDLAGTFVQARIIEAHAWFLAGELL